MIDTDPEHLFQALARAVVTSAKLRGTSHGPLNEELKWKKLNDDIQKDLRDEASVMSRPLKQYDDC